VPPAGQDDIFIARTGKASRADRRRRSAGKTPPPAPSPPPPGPGGSRLILSSPPEGGAEVPASELERQYEETAHRREKFVRITLADRSLQTVFQPIVDLRTGGTVGAEALARFTAPPFRAPDLWFAEAAELGLGTELEVTALRSALEQLEKLPSGLYLSINASPATIVSAEFRASMAEIPAERVVLELTEHTGVDDYHLFGEAIAELRSNGLRLAVDDAGSGFSSFRHILNLRPDIIKLDIALTRGIDTDPARRALGSAMLTFGLDAYNASIVAEGVETQSELTTLQGLGCHYGQGYYLGRPAQMSVLTRQQGRTGARPSPVLRRGTVDPALVLPPEFDELEDELRERAETAGTR
jgi:EAL domain-containing protein (putative c-di-GMP-specific phosphodiesterase class I)